MQLVDRIRARGVAVDAEHHLPVGDALWVARPRLGGAAAGAGSFGAARELHVLGFLLERKGVKDLAQSIKDQRYGQQKYFMTMAGMSRNFYLVEGDPELDDSLTEVERKAVKTATLQTNLAGFHMLFTTCGHAQNAHAHVQASLQGARQAASSAAAAHTWRP
eukprot:350255-Chlamydomonas_euryale.AAC.42